MSVEHFCERYSANSNIGAIAIKGQPGRSLPVVFAEQLAREGQDGSREIIKRLSPSNTMFDLDRKSFQELPEKDRKDLFTNFAAFVFGNAVLSLERTLVDRKYDHGDFCERYNLAANSLQLAEIEVGAEKIEKLSSEQLAEMYSLVKGDPTFAIFFEEKGVQALPSALRQFMESRAILLVIREEILSIYKPLVKRCVLG